MIFKFVRYVFAVIALSLLSGMAIAAPNMSISQPITGVPGATVTVPIAFVNGTGNDAAASMLVRLNFDTTKLSFVNPTTAENAANATVLSATNFTAAASGGTVTIQALRFPLAAFTNGTINLKFTINAGATAGSAALSFQTADSTTFQNANTPSTSVTVANINLTGGNVTVSIPVAGTVTITGAAVVGSTLTATAADGNGISGTPTYVWSANGVVIPGATGMTYVPVAGDIGKTITVQATYTDNIGTAETPTSTATAAVVAASAAGTVTIGGTAQVGQTLTATVADANGVPAAVTYQWSANGVAITNATTNTYTPIAGDIGKTITVQATYTDNAGNSETPTSAATAAVIPVTNAPGTVSITGTAQVGSTLTAAVADSNGVPAAVTYQWSANGVAITGATTNTYTPAAPADLGKAITVQATYTDNDTHAEAPVSAATSQVMAAATAPAITADGQPAKASTTTPAVGSNTHFGTQNVNTGTDTKTYTVAGAGTTVTAAIVSINSLPGEFEVNLVGGNFVVTFKPAAPGLREAYLEFSTGTPSAVFSRVRIAGVGASAVSPAAAQNIPVFGPLGLLAMLAGLFFFGGKRRFRKK